MEFDEKELMILKIALKNLYNVLDSFEYEREIDLFGIDRNDVFNVAEKIGVSI